MPPEHCKASVADWLRCAFETTSDRISWGVAAVVGATATITPNMLATWGAVILVALNCVHVVIKIRKELKG